MPRDINELKARLGNDIPWSSRLTEALTHRSYAVENSLSYDNQRLEFLGDSVLGFISAGYFYRNYDFPEGELTKHRAAKVCENALCVFARELDIGSALLLGKGELRMGGREKPSILADAFEAVLAAVYLDGGLEEASKLALRFVARNDSIQETKDYKTILQEIIQRNPEEHIEYVLTGSSGPDHAKSFNVEVHLNSNVIGRGVGRSKKLAEQHAAKEALELMGIK